MKEEKKKKILSVGLIVLLTMVCLSWACRNFRNGDYGICWNPSRSFCNGNGKLETCYILWKRNV